METLANCEKHFQELNLKQQEEIHASNSITEPIGHQTKNRR